MSSIVPGFEYDIFISYRHNDNRSGWVTDFVNALKEELAATIKEPLSIYFDKNPHDGLLETHSVDKSLEGKLKCLIFIPIISQTYCDPKSFAWQHEFCAFNRMCNEDAPLSSGEGPGVRSFGRNIKLSNGNVASRILPIKIHELDADDKAIIESETEGALRAIEFIYKEAGVNRPLKSADSKNENQSKTDYRNQVNKVANAIKEIVTSLKNSGSQPDSTITNHQPVTKPNKKPLIAIITSIFLVSITGYFLYPKLVQQTSPTITLDKSIAVLPFVNMSNDPEQEYFSDGLTEELLNLLAKMKELRVIGRTSSFSFKGKNEDLRTIGEKLGVSYILEGSVRRSENNLRITAQLINTLDGSHLWSETYNRQLSEVFAVQDEIASNVVEQLKIKIGVATANAPRNKNIESYKLLLESRFLGDQRLPGSERKRIELMEKALRVDSMDAELWAELALACLTSDQNSVMRKQQLTMGAKAAKRAVALDPQLPEAHFALGKMMQFYYWDWAKAEAEYSQAAKLNQRFSGATYSINMTMGRFKLALNDALKNLKDDPLNPESWSTVASAYQYLGETSKAIEYHKKLLELIPFSDGAHAQFATSLAEAGLMDEALIELGKISDKNSPRFLSVSARIYLFLGDNQKAGEYLNKLIASDEKPIDNSLGIANIFAQQGKNQEAMKWLNTASERKHPSICFIFSTASKKFGTNKTWFPALYGLRNYPEFKSLLRKMNLPDTFDN